MSLETTYTEPLPTGADAAQHAEPEPSHALTLMSLSFTDYCEALTSEPRLKLGGDTDTQDRLNSPPQPLEPEPEPEPEADAQILEALRSAKDRLFVLKLGENMEALIQERLIGNRMELTPGSTYHKLLVHRCAAYYRLMPETEAGSKSIAIIVASESRIPARRVADLVPLDDAPLPAFKIMRRTQQHRTRSKASSQVGSGNDDNPIGTGDLSDGEPSEAGSSRGSRKKPLTMSERQAQYEEARSRIFKDLEETERDMSASSSTLSLLSVGSSSGGGGGGGTSSVGESLDETSSGDHDWVSSGAKNKLDGGRRSESAASGSSRSLRSAPPAFNGHGHSPGFIYPTLYEPAPTSSTSSSSSYDSSPSSGSSQAPYQPTLYPVYQYGSPTYLAPYPYPYYPYAHPYPHVAPPPPPQHPPDSSATTASDSPASSPADTYPHVAIMNPYMWGAPPPPPSHHQPAQQQQQNQPQQAQCSPPEYAHPQYPHPSLPPYPYSAPHPPPGYLPLLPPPVQQPYTHHAGRSQNQGPQGPQSHSPLSHASHESHRVARPFGLNHVNGSNSQPQLYQPGAYDEPADASSPVSRNGGGTGPKRIQPRSGWSFGPGVGGSGGGMTGETMGPRMNISRRTSGGPSTMSGYAGNRTPGDETASIASSSTGSSSSRQTFTSTSSKHPLPARPDWAVGLKPQPTLHHSSSHHSSPRSHHGHLPSQSHPHHQRPPLPMPLQSNDFPPLTVSPPKPVLGGVWAGSSTTRSILGPSLGRLNNGNGPGVNLNVNGHNVGNVNGGLPPGQSDQQNTRLDEHDRVFERPGPKAGGELFNPNGLGPGSRVGAKSPPRKASEKERVDKDKASARGEAIANAILVDGVGALRIVHESGEQGGGTANGEGAAG